MVNLRQSGNAHSSSGSQSIICTTINKSPAVFVHELPPCAACAVLSNRTYSYARARVPFRVFHQIAHSNVYYLLFLPSSRHSYRFRFVSASSQQQRPPQVESNTTRSVVATGGERKVYLLIFLLQFFTRFNILLFTFFFCSAELINVFAS